MDDDVVSRIPIRFSNALAPRIHIHQFPLLTRPLQVPPSAAASGKRITARIKPVVRRLEVHIPSDTRSEVWNSERGRELGAARLEDDRERNQEAKGKGREMDEPRLSEVRMLSEQVEQPGVYMLGIVRDGQLHLHPISETHQLRPTLTYLDALSRKNKRSRPGDDSDSDDGPPPDPDEPAPAPTPKKERKTVGEAREVHVTARKTDDKSGGAQPLGGLSTARREMLAAIHAEEDEGWHDLQFFDVTTAESEEAFTGLFSQSDEVLQCKEDQTAFLVEGLDTESDEQDACASPNLFLPQCLPEEAPQSILASILKLKLDLPPIDILVQDTEIQQMISEASTEILSFLESFQELVVRSTNDDEVRQRLVEFGALVDISFLDTLFSHRRVFLAIASRNADHHSGAVVCWVDAILMKIGDAAVSIASGVPLERLRTAFCFPGHRDDGLRAASQLPANWISVSSVMGSENASPAARRLALRLTFAAFVLGPAVCSQNRSKSPVGTFEILELHLQQTQASGFSASIAGDRLAVQERLGYAMLICLFATIDREHHTATKRIQVHPHSLACLLRVVQEVIHPEKTLPELELVNPTKDVDHPIGLLLSWGNAIPWCWEIWDDHRMVNSESIVYLTALWLQNVDDPAASITTTASSIAILRVLHHIVLALSNLSPASDSSPVSTVVLLNACRCGIKCLKSLTGASKSEERWIVSGYAKLFLSLFVLSPPKPSEKHVVDLALEALSLVAPDTLGLCIIHVQQDPELRFSARFNERLTLVRNHVSTNPQVTWNADGLALVRASLNCMSIIWLSTTPGGVPKQPALALLSATIEFLSHKDSSGLLFAIIGDAVLGAVAAAKLDQYQDKLWKLAMLGPRAVYLVGAFAHHLCTAETLPSSLYCAEAWRHLGETLLLILKHHYIDEQEPLALLVSPTICRALVRLLQTEPAGRQYMLSTPLTMNICDALNSTLAATQCDEYGSLLRSQLGLVGPGFLEAIKNKSSIEGSVQGRVIFYRLEDGAGRLAIVESV
uniref:RNA polymerase II-associated protein 1 C-terminal domain-containing protein n=1 Tax=Mycena chlorophos TaxID=658473 RepID=A0ABQ0L9N1_MYCCL|nr:predicted protein [Mycena chlorophos]